MKKGIFAMFILVASMAMMACTNTNNNTSTERTTVGENDASKVLEKRREYYKEQDKERAKMGAGTQVQIGATGEEVIVTTEDEIKAREEALEILEKKRKGN